MRIFKIISILLAVMVILSGCTVTINGEEVDAFDFGDFFGSTKLETDTQKEEIEAAKYKEVEINGNAADVKILAGKGDKITAVFHKEIESFGSRSLIDDVRLEVKEESNKVILNVVYVTGTSVKSETRERDGVVVHNSIIFNGLKVRRMNLNLEVTIPEQLENVKVTSGSGEIYVDELKDKANITVISGSGDKVLGNIGAEVVKIHSGSGSLSLDNLTANEAEIVSSSGNKALGHIEAETVKIHSGSGGLSLDNLTAGEAEIVSSSGNKTIADVQVEHMEIKSGSGKMEIRKVNGDEIIITTSSGDITAQTVQSDLRMSAGSANIDILEYEGMLQLNASSGDVKVSSGRFREGTILTTGSGDISLDGTFEESAKAYECNTSSGDVTITIPADYPFNIDARSSSGRITCDFRDVEKLNDFERRRDTELEAKVNGGGTPFRVRTGSGRINFLRR